MGQSNWKESPASGSWNDDGNWQPEGTPSGTAVFGATRVTQLDFLPTSAAQVESIEFAAGAPPYVLSFGPGDTTPALTITGSGVRNDSTSLQHFRIASTSSGADDPQLVFSGSACAGGRDVFYEAGPISTQGAGGGVIRFRDNSTAGQAQFVAWCGAEPPPHGSTSFTVGGEVNFSDQSSADHGTFTTWGTLGTDGDTFGNVVFWNKATAGNGTFTSKGGTVGSGDGGNTQFYDQTTAGNGTFHNCGAVTAKGNGGDVAFDSVATGGNGYFHNYCGTVTDANGGVTSFNNNPSSWPPPDPPSLREDEGATAGNGIYVNYAATSAGMGNGGHTEFSAKYGACTGGAGQFLNHGCGVATDHTGSAGHTAFYVTVEPKPKDGEPSKTTVLYRPTAGNAVIWNFAGTVAGAPGGYTSFTAYPPYGVPWSNDMPWPKRPATAGEATIFNLGGTVKGALPGNTTFSLNCTAGSATLVAEGGTQGADGGLIQFQDKTEADDATICLNGNGTLDLTGMSKTLTVATLQAAGGLIRQKIGKKATRLEVTKALDLLGEKLTFEFDCDTDGGFDPDDDYTVLESSALEDADDSQFRGSCNLDYKVRLKVKGDKLKASFKR